MNKPDLIEQTRIVTAPATGRPIRIYDMTIRLYFDDRRPPLTAQAHAAARDADTAALVLFNHARSGRDPKDGSRFEAVDYDVIEAKVLAEALHSDIADPAPIVEIPAPARKEKPC